MTKQETWLSSPHYLFLGFCIMHALIWFLEPMSTRFNLPFDSIESIAWGQMWQTGYDKHPFLAAWLAYTATLMGSSLEISLYALAQASIILSFFCIWRLARHLLTERQALLSVMLLQGIWYFNILTPKFDPNTLMILAWSVTSLTAYHAIFNGGYRYWFFLGLVSGFSILSKYQAIISLTIVALVLLQNRKYIQDFYTKTLLGFLTFLATISPNLIWLWQSDFIPFQYAIERITSSTSSGVLHHLWVPVDFLLEQIGASIIFILACLPLYYKPKVVQIGERQQSFVLWIGLGPLLLTMLIALFSGMYLYAKWGAHYLIHFGLIAMLWLKPHITKSTLKTYIIVLICLMLTFGFMHFSYLKWYPVYSQKADSTAYFPGKEIANKLNQLWREKTQRPLGYVVGNQYLVANISVYAKDKPIPYFRWTSSYNPWIDTKNFKQSGGLFVWHGEEVTNEYMPNKVKKHFPYVIDLGHFDFQPHVPILTKPIQIRVLLLPPQQSVSNDVLVER